MRLLVPLGLLLLGIFAAGCITQGDDTFAMQTAIAGKPTNSIQSAAPPKPKPVKKKKTAPVVTAPKPSKTWAKKTNVISAAPIGITLPTIVTPDNSLAGEVVSYNSAGRFVVLSFPAGQMPKTGENLFLYRGGFKVGEIKITGPQNDNDTVADLVSGDAQVGDEVRDQ
jgi:hypothetical protein